MKLPMIEACITCKHVCRTKKEEMQIISNMPVIVI